MAERLCEFESHLGHLKNPQVFDFKYLWIFLFIFLSTTFICVTFVNAVDAFGENNLYVAV